ncbi:hypothetical protein RRF57_010365 [Xylaria bambusicola]|uniref:Uncharacterized protein n=1 Tax=Xylaria bambusicola TaxID=326684 RepID=A0AAN7Z8G7_9PEZI
MPESDPWIILRTKTLTQPIPTVIPFRSAKKPLSSVASPEEWYQSRPVVTRFAAEEDESSWKGRC